MSESSQAGGGKKPQNTAGLRRGGGRPKGSKNKVTKDVQDFVERVFACLEEQTGKTPEEYAVHLLQSCKSEKVQGMIFQTLLAYRFGKPKESVEHSGLEGGPIGLQVTFVDRGTG